MAVSDGSENLCKDLLSEVPSLTRSFLWRDDGLLMVAFGTEPDALASLDAYQQFVKANIKRIRYSQHRFQRHLSTRLYVLPVRKMIAKVLHHLHLGPSSFLSQLFDSSC